MASVVSLGTRPMSQILMIADTRQSSTLTLVSCPLLKVCEVLMRWEIRSAQD